MSKIKIITDAASDISSEDELKYGIRVIPFQVTLGDESYTTRVDMDNAQFYARMAQCDEIPKTAQVNPFQFQEIYLQEAQAGYTDLILVLIKARPLIATLFWPLSSFLKNTRNTGTGYTSTASTVWATPLFTARQ